MTRKQVFCIKWGAADGPEYVNILYAMAARNITGHFAVICFTDNTSGIRAEVECLPLPQLGCEIPADVPGKWPKQALWKRDLFGLEGLALFLDLDVVIVDNIDCYFEYGEAKDVIVARNPMRLFGRHGQTSVFRYRVGAHACLRETLVTEPVRISRRYRYEQNYVTACIRGGVRFWPEARTKHFRIDCLGVGSPRFVRPAVLPRGAKIVIVPGHPSHPDATVGQRSPKLGCQSRRERLQWVWGNRRPWNWLRKKVHHFNLPAPWVGEYWRE